MQGNSSSIAHNELAFRASPLPRRLWRLQLRLNRTEPSRSRRPAGSAWLLTLAVARWKRHMTTFSASFSLPPFQDYVYLFTEDAQGAAWRR